MQKLASSVCYKYERVENGAYDAKWFFERRGHIFNFSFLLYLTLAIYILVNNSDSSVIVLIRI